MILIGNEMEDILGLDLDTVSSYKMVLELEGTLLSVDFGKETV